MLNLLTFSVSNFRFAMDLDRTNKVVPLMALRTVPKADPCVVGVMDLSGASIPVIDLSIRLDLGEAQPYDLTTSVIICQKGDQQFGVIASKIDGVETISSKQIKLDDILHSETMPYKGVYRGRKEDQVLILDLDRVLTLQCVVSSASMPMDLVTALGGTPV